MSLSLSSAMFSQFIGFSAGVLLLTSILLVWRRSLVPAARLLAVQGAAVAALAGFLGWYEQEPELLVIAVMVFALKVGVIPWVLVRATRANPSDRDDVPMINTPAALIWTAVVTVAAYIVAQPVAELAPGPGASAVPVGFALVLIGFLLLMIRRHAISQLIGFLVLDNGIAAIAFLTVGGVPFVVEVGASLDVLFVVLILYVVTNRMTVQFGVIDLDDLQELHD